jgi:hypothetical protein
VTDVPKIVKYRLRAGGPGRPVDPSHPDADVLAAFTEQALSQAERETVLGHLALCADCREVAVLALPATEAVAAFARTDAVAAEAETVSTPIANNPRRNWFAWADMRSFNLRWAALAAGVAVALFAGYVGLGHHRNPVSPGTAQTAISTGPSAPGPSNPGQIASALPPQNSLEADASKTLAQPATTKESHEISSGHMQTAFAKKSAVGQPGALAANNRGAQSAASTEMSAAVAGNLPSSTPASANGPVETSAATTEVATASSDTDEMARRQTPSVEKAKPPVDETVAGKTTIAAARAPMALQANGAFATSSALPAATLKQGTIWMVAAGILKRSLDGGRSWQTALEGEHLWLCYAAHGQEVWAGGQAGALQHSNDGGASWHSIAVTARGQSLNSDVIHIDVQYPKIALITASQEVWSSSDGGKTWEKK